MVARIQCQFSKTSINLHWHAANFFRLRFSFSKLHQDELKIMSELCKKCFLMLVCNKDGIACIGYKDLKKILDDNHEEVEWISASRLARESYAIKGSDGKLKFKINLNDFPKNVTRHL